MPATHTPTLWRVTPSSAEAAVYEGEYRGTWLRLTRLTDPNTDGGTPETRWDGFIRTGASWDCEAMCYPSRRAALARLMNHIDDVLEGRT